LRSGVLVASKELTIYYKQEQAQATKLDVLLSKKGVVVEEVVE
jgi:hypothetical protein